MPPNQYVKINRDSYRLFEGGRRALFIDPFGGVEKQSIYDARAKLRPWFARAFWPIIG